MPTIVITFMIITSLVETNPLKKAAKFTSTLNEWDGQCEGTKK